MPASRHLDVGRRKLGRKRHAATLEIERHTALFNNYMWLAHKHLAGIDTIVHPVDVK